MPLPTTYRKSGEGAIASYDFFDIAEGTGYVTFFGAKTQSGFVLIKTAVNSDFVETTGISDTTDDVAKFDEDFDLTLNIPKVVKGKLLVDVPATNDFQSGTAATTLSCKVKVLFRKWDGDNETEIANATSITRAVDSGTGIDHEKRFLIEVTIPRTKFKKGETIRVTLELYAWEAVDNVLAWFAIGHDPKSRASTLTGATSQKVLAAGNTDLFIHIPFEVDL